MLRDSRVIAKQDKDNTQQDEIEFLKNSVLELNAKKDELIKNIDDYNYRYNIAFKDILYEILYLKRSNHIEKLNSLKKYYIDLYYEFQKEHKILSSLQELKLSLSKKASVEEIDKKILEHTENMKLLKKEIENLKIKEAKQDCSESNFNFNQFNNIFEQEVQNDKCTLSVEKEKELKSIYKKAAHLCHPDIVDKSRKNDAQDIFKELNKAYVDKDLNLIKEMLLFLGNGEIFNTKRFKLSDEDSLQKTINELKQKKETLTKDIHFIKCEHEFSFIFSIKDEKAYFKNVESNLLQLLSELKDHKIDPIKNRDKIWIKKIYQYANKYKISNEIIPRDSNLLKKITKLDLSSKNLLYITSAISNLEFLETLNLSNNNLLNIPTEFSKLKNLRELNISRNKFDNIPEVIFKIASLSNLDISKNNLHEVPKEIAQNDKLVYLDLGGNLINKIADEISKLKLLKLLSLWGNKLSNIPDNLTLLTSLEDLKLGSNNLKTLPKNITKLTNLENLEIFMNQDLVLSKKQKEWQLKINDSLFIL